MRWGLQMSKRAKRVRSLPGTRSSKTISFPAKRSERSTRQPSLQFLASTSCLTSTSGIDRFSQDQDVCERASRLKYACAGSQSTTPRVQDREDGQGSQAPVVHAAASSDASEHPGSGDI
eukprot:162824-Amorphochlora_amoeboformis.AAC.1